MATESIPANDESLPLEQMKANDKSRGTRIGMEATLFDELSGCYERVLLWEADPEYTKDDVVKGTKDILAVLLTKCLTAPHIGSMFAHGGDELEALKYRREAQREDWDADADSKRPDERATAEDLLVDDLEDDS